MLTVVIPTANNKTDLAVLLIQLQQQSVLPKQIYIADNSEEGYGVELAKRYFFSVPIAVEKNPGTIYQSWNAGMEYAKSDVLILNDDLLISRHFIRDFEGHSPTMVTTPAQEGFPKVPFVRGEYLWENKNSGSTAGFIKGVKHEYLPSLRGWCFKVPLFVQKTIGNFDEQFDIWYGDKDYEMRLLERDFWIKFINTPVSHYGTSSYSKIPKEMFDAKNFSDQVKFERKYLLKHTDLGWDTDLV